MKFEMGEIAIVINSNAPTLSSGAEIEIYKVGPLQDYDLERPIHPGYRDQGDWMDYEIVCPAGYHWGCAEKNLRKKKPPEELTGLENVRRITGWSPTKTTEEMT